MALRGARTAALVAAALTIGAWPAAARAVGQDIVVTPGAPHPGERVHISVPGCSVGPTEHTAVSAVFPADVTLHGKAETGDADVTIRPDVKPGTYAIAAHCGTTTVQGRIAVTGESGQPARRKTDYWLLIVPVLVLAAVAGVFLLRRRETG
jgi:hypothetical protein